MKKPYKVPAIVYQPADGVPLYAGFALCACDGAGCYGRILMSFGHPDMASAKAALDPAIRDWQHKPPEYDRWQMDAKARAQA
jgi:hypothetical protein